MPLQPPKLDDRDFDSLVKEARSRIPRYLPEWTDWNPSDPGITLLQLHAWLTETILFRLNRLPDLNYIKFLQLLGVEQRPARPALADLTFMLREKVDAPEILIEKGARISVSARDLEAPVIFETDRTLVAVSARLARLIHFAGASAAPQNVTEDNNFDGRGFAPFGSPAATGAYLMLGFKSKLPFTREEIGLQIYLEEEGQAVLVEAPAADCAPQTADPTAPRLVWELWDGTSWDELDKTGDETRELTRSGRVFFRVPGQIPAVPESAVTGQPTTSPPQLAEVSGVDAMIIAQLTSASITTVRMLTDLSLDDLLGILGFPVEPTEAQIELAEQILADANRLVDEATPLFYWLRVRLAGGAYAQAPKIDRVLTNTVGATAAQTVFDEAVGSSDGSPNQKMALRHKPVLAEPALILEIDEGEGPRLWSERPDFFASKSDDPHYVFNRNTGEIRFGDGRRGRIPVAGQFNVIAREYRYGGGKTGNVGAGTATDLLTPITEVDSVTNYRPGEGGADEEPLSDTMLRAPRELKSRNRAVTLEDFALLSKETPGALVGRSFAHVIDDPTGGIVKVVIVPLSESPKPVPAEASLERVCRYLDERRLITTRLTVSGPTFHDIDVVAHLRASDEADLKEVKNAAAARLADYFHPFKGGADGGGWPFGRNVYYSGLVREIMALPGVLRVENLKLRKFLRQLSPSEISAFPEDDPFDFPPTHTFPPLGVRIVEPGENEDDPPQTLYYEVEIVSCRDMQVDEGALIALRRTEIFVSYDRAGGAV